MSDRDLTTTKKQVFGDVSTGTECRVCGRNVTDGRSKTCSDYCNNLLSGVMGMLNWSSVRRQIIDRDDETCQKCGFDYGKERLSRDHISDIIEEKVGDRPEGPPLDGVDEWDDADWEDHFERVDEWSDHRDELKERYGTPHERTRRLEVDHITPISKGGHPFDPMNLQTLCEGCHKEKTAEEAGQRAERRATSRPEVESKLFDYVSGGENV